MDLRSKKKAEKKDRKKFLCSELAAAVRKLQEEHILARKVKSFHSDTTPAEHLCNVLEAVFLHELKNNKGQLWRDLKKPTPQNPPEPSYWTFIDPLVSDDIKRQLYALRNSDSDIRKCRSWVRLTLSKGVILTFFEDLQRHPGLLAFHYGGDAIMRDPELSEVIVQLLKGLTTLQLQFDYTSASLNTWDPPVLQMAGVWSPPTKMYSRESSKGGDRISPPVSDFDFEGVSIIDLALDKYSKRKEVYDNFTDSQLISNEAQEQMSQTSDTSRGSMSDLDAEMPVGSYGAMLRSYARRSNSVDSKPQKVPTIGTPETQPRVRGHTVFGTTPSESGMFKDRSDYALALSLNYEVVTPDGSVAAPPQSNPNQQMTSLLTKLVNEKGLDSQSYHCEGCRRPIGIIFGEAKLCKFNGYYYCFDCHSDNERVIPARVLFNWDFRKHKVCDVSSDFLDSIEHKPLLNVHEANKTLYVYIPELEEALKLRQQLKHLKDYLLTCKDQDVSEQFKKRVRLPYLYEDEHLYSLHDLTEVYSGALNDRLKKAIKSGKKHVKQCPLCSQKGFICEMCHSDQVIYPFELEDTHQCQSCNALYHKKCKPLKDDCPKCIRIQRRKQAVGTASTE